MLLTTQHMDKLAAELIHEMRHTLRYMSIIDLDQNRSIAEL